MLRGDEQQAEKMPSYSGNAAEDSGLERSGAERSSTLGLALGGEPDAMMLHMGLCQIGRFPAVLYARRGKKSVGFSFLSYISMFNSTPTTITHADIFAEESIVVP